MHFLREPADVVMTLDHMRRIAADRDTFNYVGIQGALRQEMVPAGSTRPVRRILSEQFLGRVFENFHKLTADDLSLFLGIGDAFEQLEETIRRVHVLESNMKVLLENALDHFFFARAEQPVVNEDAGELVSDRFVQQRRHDR